MLLEVQCDVCILFEILPPDWTVWKQLGIIKPTFFIFVMITVMRGSF